MTNFKRWKYDKLFKKKSFWGALGGICTGIGLLVAGNTPEGAAMIWASIQAVFIAHGQVKNMPVKRKPRVCPDCGQYMTDERIRPRDKGDGWIEWICVCKKENKEPSE